MHVYSNLDGGPLTKQPRLRDFPTEICLIVILAKMIIIVIRKVFETSISCSILSNAIMPLTKKHDFFYKQLVYKQQSSIQKIIKQLQFCTDMRVSNYKCIIS